MGSTSLLDQLQRTSQELFVGRKQELQRLASCLESPPPGPQFVTLEGVAGVGKTTLAQVLSAHAAQQGNRVAWLSFDERMRTISDLKTTLATIDWGARAGGDTGRDLLVFDSVERAPELLTWLFHEGLRSVQDNTMVLLTSRARLPALLRARLLATGRLNELHLENLDQESAAKLASKLGLASDRQEWAHEVCRGHPLAIILLAGTLTEADDEFEPTLPGNTALELAAYFTASLDPTQRAILRVAAIASCYDEDLFAAACPDIESAERARAHDWLRSQAFVVVAQRGLRLHDTVREAIFADLVSQSPTVYDAYSRRIAVELSRRMVALNGPGVGHVGTELTFARRGISGLNELISGDMTGVSDAWVEIAGDTARATARDLVERHEGEEEAGRFWAWTAAQPLSLFVVRSSAEEIIGVIFHPILRSDEETVEDPVVDAFLDAIDRNTDATGPVGFFRWFFAAESYQDFSPELTAVMLSGPQVHVLLGERFLPLSGFVTHEPERWVKLAPRMMVQPLDAPELLHAGRRYGFWLVDLRADNDEARSRLQETLQRHIRILLESVMIDPDNPFTTLSTPALPAPEQLSCDGEQEHPSKRKITFTTADVRSALRALGRPAQLDASPLAELVAKSNGEVRRGRALAALLRRRIEELEGDPHSSECGRLLRRAYLEPAPKHLALASELGLPYGTFRHRLRASIERLTELILSGC